MPFRLLVLFLCLSPLFSYSQINDTILWHHDFDLAISQSQASQKPVLIYFSGKDWCKSCIRLRKEILESQKFLSFAEGSLILMNADFPRKRANQLPKQQQLQNDKLAAKYNSTGVFPKLVLLSPTEKILAEYAYAEESVEVFIKKIKPLLNK